MEGIESEVQVEEWQNHFVHLDVIEELLNSIEFRLVSKKDVTLKKRIVTHREMHKQILRASIMSGAVPPGGSPPPGGNVKNVGINPT